MAIETQILSREMAHAYLSGTTSAKSAIRNTLYATCCLESCVCCLWSFLTNKPNFRKSQMNANTFTQMAYKNKSNWTIGQNKPNSNPIKPNFQKAKMNVNLYVIEDYRKKDDFVVRINKPNFVKGQK